MKAIQRLKEYIEYKGLNNSSFEKKIDISNGYIGTQLKRNADLGEGILTKVLENCLDIDLTWLITGQGEMLKVEESPVETPTPANQNESPYIKKHIALMQKHIELQEQIIAIQAENIDLKLRVERCEKITAK